MATLKLVFDADENKKINLLKQEYGLKTTTELVRLLIALHYKEITKEKKVKPT